MMKGLTYEIHVRVITDIIKREVEAIPIQIQGFEFMELFISQADGSYGLEDVNGINNNNIKGKYIISEATTGLYCAGPFDDPEEAYFELSKHLNLMGPQIVKESLEQARKLMQQN